MDFMTMAKLEKMFLQNPKCQQSEDPDMCALKMSIAMLGISVMGRQCFKKCHNPIDYYNRACITECTDLVANEMEYQLN